MKIDFAESLYVNNSDKFFDGILGGGLSKTILTGGQTGVVIGSLDKRHSSNKIFSTDDVCPTLCAAMGMGGGWVPMILDEDSVRIRKLTPKESFRLMGVKDEDYDKLTVSDSQKYKQAGNSIVVNVLMAIFENMFINDCKDGRLF